MKQRISIITEIVDIEQGIAKILSTEGASLAVEKLEGELFTEFPLGTRITFTGLVSADDPGYVEIIDMEVE